MNNYMDRQLILGLKCPDSFNAAKKLKFNLLNTSVHRMVNFYNLRILDIRSFYLMSGNPKLTAIFNQHEIKKLGWFIVK